MPARAPPSIDMLQTVMRPSIVSARIGLAGIFDHVAGAAGGADLADDGEDDVLRGDAFGKLAVDAERACSSPFLDQRLRGEHVLDFGGADAVRQRAERAVRRGVAVAADDRHAGQREALLRADDVDDALALVVLVVILDAELLALLRERLDLLRLRDRVGDRLASGRRSERCDRRWPSFSGGAPCGRPCAGLRTPAALVTSWTRWRSI
jgi:hypothetical protein